MSGAGASRAGPGRALCGGEAGPFCNPDASALWPGQGGGQPGGFVPLTCPPRVLDGGTGPTGISLAGSDVEKGKMFPKK